MTGHYGIYHKSQAIIKNDTSTTAIEFLFFPKLPGELRAKIWQMSLPGPRLLCADRINLNEVSLPPTLFRVSQEARGEALKRFSELWKLDNVNGPYRPMWIDPKADNIFLKMPPPFGFMDDPRAKPRVSSAESLVLDASEVWQVWDLGYDRFIDEFNFMLHYPKLKKITLLLAPLPTTSRSFDSGKSAVATKFNILPALKMPIVEWPATFSPDITQTDFFHRDCMEEIENQGWKGYFTIVHDFGHRSSVSRGQPAQSKVRGGQAYPEQIHEKLREFLTAFEKAMAKMARKDPGWQLPLIELSHAEVDSWEDIDLSRDW